MYKYPYGDSQQLNLDWILAKLKELEASGGAGGGADLEEVSNALISLTYNTSTAYRRYDYAFRNDKLYRCLTDTSGSFDPSAWQEALIGDDLAVLTRWINAIDAAAVVDVKFDTSGTNGKLQQKYNDNYHDVVEVDYTPVQYSKRPLSSNAGYDLNTAINDNATAIANTRAMLAKVYDAGETATSIHRVGELVIYEGYAAQVIAPIAVGDSFVWNTNIKGTTISTELYGWNAKLTGTFTKNNNSDTIVESRFIQKGRICEVHFIVTRSGNFTAGVEVIIGKLSNMQLPPISIRNINGCGSNAYTITGFSYCTIAPNGDVKVNPSISCSTILVDFIYTVD